MLVDHFGLHFTPSGVGLLVQENSVTNALDLEVDIPVEIRRGYWDIRCPHNIDLSEALDAPLPSDPLIDHMLPVPKVGTPEPTFLVDDEPTRKVVHQLMRMSSISGKSQMFPMWAREAVYFSRLLSLTNVTPLVLYGYQGTQHKKLNLIIEASIYLPRKLIVLLPPLPLMAKGTKLTTSLDPTELATLPLEKIGAHHLRQVMLRAA